MDYSKKRMRADVGFDGKAPEANVKDKPYSFWAGIRVGTDWLSERSQIKKAASQNRYDPLFSMVPEPGIEPGCPCERGILSFIRRKIC
jgi:hypothetical protein